MIHILRRLSLVSVLLALAGCGPHRDEQNAAPPAIPTATVRVSPVESKSRALYEEVVGTVRAKRQATLESKMNGRVLQMPVVLGERVTRGQLIAKLDAPEIAARLEQAEAAQEQAERDWKRASSLFAQQSATRAEYDAAQTRLRGAQGAVAEAKAMMAYVQIEAPFDGVITRKWADVGDLAVPGKPLIELEDPSALQLEADVPEAIASRVEPKSRLSIKAAGLTNDISGVVAEMAPTADPLSRTFRIKLDLAPASGIVSGQFARLLVPLGERTYLGVPAEALVQRGQLDIVFTVANQKASLRLVKPGKRLGDEVEIVSGLHAGDSVVTQGAAQLVDGQPVESR